MLDAAAYAYPWDLVGDPAAPETLAGLGVDHVSVAAVYHATRALTPRHPRHRVVTAEHTAAYLPIDGVPSAAWMSGTDSFGESVAALAEAGLPAHAWVVVNHVDPAGTDHPSAVVNAFGDRYPWALCPSNPEAFDYAVDLAAAVALRSDIAGIEFEAAGWYGFDHLHEHDKISGIRLTEEDQTLLSFCFCTYCEDGYRSAGVGFARQDVRAALDDTFAGRAARGVGVEALAAASAVRESVARRLREAIVAEVRKHRPDASFPVVFHGNPDTRRSTAFTGMDPATLPEGTTGMVVNCWQNADSAEATAQACRDGVRTYASILGVQGMGAASARTREIVTAAREAGAAGIRIYHAGLASESDLDLIRDLVAFAHTR